jgi:DNA-binding phage protein
MTMSPKTFVISALSENNPLSLAQFAYFRARLKSRIHEAILEVFEQRKKTGLTKAELSRRLGKAPEQVTRWLSAPGNLRLDTVSDLLLAMNSELVFNVVEIEQRRQTNEHQAGGGD